MGDFNDDAHARVPMMARTGIATFTRGDAADVYVALSTGWGP